MNKIIERGIQLIQIADDFSNRYDGDPEEIYDFDQTWGSTALGFGGYGGSAIITERTYVVISNKRAFIYFGNNFAYSVPVCDELLEDIKNKSIVSVNKIGRYTKNDGI